MVRLRTNRWYGSERRQSSSGSAYPSSNRRLISLCIMLGLIVVLMQRASNPTYIKNAFSSLGAPLDGAPRSKLQQVGQPSEPTLGPQTSTTAQTATPKPTTAQTAPPKPTAPNKIKQLADDLLPRLLDPATPSQLRVLSTIWFAINTQSLNQSDTGELARLQEEATAILNTLASEVKEGDVWSSEVKGFESRWNDLWIELQKGSGRKGWIASTSDDGLRNFSDSLTDYLDVRLSESLRDATPWESSESVAFWRHLQRAAHFEAGLSRTSKDDAVVSDTKLPVDVPTVSTRELEAEQKTIRGQIVRFQGAIHRAEASTRTRPEFGLNEGYWVMWLRGADENTQPVAVYTLASRAMELATRIPTDPNASESEFPQVDLIAIVGKRLAYGSSSGVEVAPTLFALEMIPIGITDELEEAVAKAPPKSDGSLYTILIASLLVAGALLAPFLLTQRQLFNAQKLKKRQREKEASNAAKLLVLLLLGPLCSNGAVAQEQLSARIESETSGETPFAKNNDNEYHKVLQNRLSLSLTANSIVELQRYLAGDDPGQVPEAVLKIMQPASQVGWNKFLTLPQPLEFNGFQLSNFSVQGIVRRAMPLDLSQEQLAWFPYSKLYRIDFQPINSNTIGTDKATENSQTDAAQSNLVTAFCSAVPNTWINAVQLHQPIELRALQLKLTDVERGLCLFLDQPNWHLPNNYALDQLQPQLKSNWLRLGQAGWNLAWIDFVRSRNQERLKSDEEVAYYTFQRAVTLLPPLEVASPTDPVDVLSNASERLGDQVQWTVRVVVASQVNVSDPSAQQILGSDHYYQYDGFVDIGNKAINYKVPGADDKSKKATIEFKGEFPTTIISREPFLIDPQQLQGRRSWEIAHYAQVDGIFYRLWAYQSELVSKQGGTFQAAPIVVAQSMVSSPPPPPTLTSPTNGFGVIIGVVCLSCIALIWIYMLRHYHVPKRSARPK